MNLPHARIRLTTPLRHCGASRNPVRLPISPGHRL